MKRISLILIVLLCLGFSAQSQDNPHYMIIDPALREMLISLDMPRYTGSDLHHMITDPALREMLISLDMPRYTGSVPIGNVAGNLQLKLSDGTYIGLKLLQSGSVVFGKGNITSGSASQLATAGGSILGNNLRLDVVPENGTEVYAISVNMGRLPLVGTYSVFRADSAPKPGTLQASWILSGV
jgi:hypothetical protein